MNSFHRLIELLASIAIAFIGSQVAANDEPSKFATIRPLITRYCVECHSAKAAKGGLDLERFSTLAHVRADIETWENVLEMIGSREMPPKNKRQLQPDQRELVLKWIGDLLDREARLRAGDPGPVLVRRLNNAEYNNVIRDLTGIDLKPARHFPADGAAGEGFLNATDALTISPDQVSKYLDAAKKVAAHAVLLPDGFRFSEVKFRAEWSTAVLDQILSLYSKYTNKFGQIPFHRYLVATVIHRDSFQSRKRLEEIAKREGLSSRYLQTVWEAMNSKEPSLFLSTVRAAWRQCETVHDAERLVNDIARLQAMLWHKRDPIGMHSLDDRYVPPGVSIASRHTWKLAMPPAAKDGTITFHIASRGFGDSADQVNLILKKARFVVPNKPPISLRDALVQTNSSRPNQLLREDDSLILRAAEILPVRVQENVVGGRTFVVDVEVGIEGQPDAIVHFDVRADAVPPSITRGVEWTDVAGAFERVFLIVPGNDQLRDKLLSGAADFRALFPARACYPGVRVIDMVVTLERYHRGDSFLSSLLLNDKERVQLNRLWEELHFISQDALDVRASFATLVQGEFVGYREVSEIIHKRAKDMEVALLNSEPTHIVQLLDFAKRAYRRSLSESEEESLRGLYQSLRNQNLPHDEALRAVMARVLVAPSFLYRLESSPAGSAARRVKDHELATRLSFFLWSTIPDNELLQLASADRLHDPEVLTNEVRRILNDSRIRALAVEFGSQWLEVRDFSAFQGKNVARFPSFDATLREAMDEETIHLFEDLFRNDRSVLSLIDTDHVFVNKTLAVHYGMPAVEGEDFRRLDGAKRFGRGGILGLGSVLSKHSGASRTSPVLRGNWITETLLGEKLPLPPDGVPKLPETETLSGFSIRQLVEQHAKLPECAKCHQRIDPLGFALEQYDTIGRRRERDAASRIIDARAELRDGTEFEGIEGLRQYLITERKGDFINQFCRKLLGYALGRRIILSDRQLLKQMAAELERNDHRVSGAVQAIVHSRQFQFIRGSEAPATGLSSNHH